MEAILNITLRLPDGRVLMSRTAPEKKWSISIEKKLGPKESALEKFNETMWQLFGIDSVVYSDDFVEMEVMAPIVHKHTKIFPFLVNVKSSFIFQVPPDISFKPMYSVDIVNDIMTKTVYCDHRMESMHTENSVLVAGAIDKKGFL